MPPSGPPTEQEIWKIARRTTDIIQSNITRNVCLFGSAACSLYVNIGRVPHSNLGYMTQKTKAIIAQADNRYYLAKSRIRGATHKKLYCRLPGWKTDKGRCIKADILVPPTLGLPNITEFDIYFINDIPVMGTFDLLVMKTQGWWDHLTSPRKDFQAKVNDDVSDIIALLDRAKLEGVSYVEVESEQDEYGHSQEFMDHAYSLANRFVNVYGTHRRWRALDFPL
ncbi:hypothetical protein DFH94DRAFT_848315 [Russula ochroleuca]|uniref:Uncharacterized protein n=1 Tax=Russula ochroleuca TaxID=152965 RepID=A0A9P5JXC3_9AGAM|nr:hypothetical protein DFH94DRAFT_848315 [Russula ochroleuca]